MWAERGTGYFTGAIAILGDNVTLIDSGTLDSPERAIIPFLRKAGHLPADITDIVLTHSHGDHSDGIPGILKVSKPVIHVHELDRPNVEELARKAGFSASIIENFNDKQLLHMSDRNLRVVHTPGHSEGSVCIFDEETHTMVSGDSVQGRGKGRPLIFNSAAAYETSMNRLLRQRVDSMMLGHPFPPYHKGVLSNDEPKAFMNDSLEAIKSLRREMGEMISNVAEPFCLDDVALHFPDLREPTIRCILDEFSEKGRLEVVEATAERKRHWVRNISSKNK
jgi:glyoxylase-like metal-dependent hydrolase (beta-lactamase superfamily II)